MIQACRDWGLRLSAWFDEDSSAMDGREIRAHLLDCAPCRGALHSWRQQRQELACLQPEALPEADLDRMVYRFEDGLAGEIRRTDLALRSWSLAAGVLFLLGLSMLAWRADSAFPAAAAASSPREVDRAVQEILDRPPPAAAPQR